MKQQLTSLEQNARQLQLQVQNIRNEGTDRVTTRTGFTFDENGLHISKTGSDVLNSITEKGMYVLRGGNAVMLQADANGVIASDVSVRNYLILGNHSRLEDYGTGRTGCFYLGG